MESTGASRGLELAICVLWVTVFYLRMRLVRLASDRAQIVQQLRSAIRPLLIGAWALTAVSVLLWIQPNWRPFAHALSVPSLLVVGMCVSFRTLE